MKKINETHPLSSLIRSKNLSFNQNYQIPVIVLNSLCDDKATRISGMGEQSQTRSCLTSWMRLDEQMVCTGIVLAQIKNKTITKVVQYTLWKNPSPFMHPLIRCVHFYVHAYMYGKEQIGVECFSQVYVNFFVSQQCNPSLPMETTGCLCC